MKRNSNLLVPNSACILMLCRKPIRISTLVDKTAFGGYTVFRYYLNYLKEENLVNINEMGRNKEVTITEKGREALKLWIELNKRLGIEICQYI